jgi:hypothetical protein
MLFFSLLLLFGQLAIAAPAISNRRLAAADIDELRAKGLSEVNTPFNQPVKRSSILRASTERNSRVPSLATSNTKLTIPSHG